MARMLCAGALVGCGEYPRDAEDSTRRARTSAMRVGVSHDPPHVVLAPEAEPRGDDIARVRALGQALGVRIVWVPLGHERLMADLMAFRLHLVAGGHGDDSPWEPRVGWSRPWGVPAGAGGPRAERRFALPPGENAWQLAVDRFLRGHDLRPGRAP